MRDRIGFVAVGQAGGNLGQLFEEQGYSVLYINTSQEDLSTLEGARYRYHIPEGEGCHKDRRKAKQLVIDDYDQIAAEIESKLQAEMLFVLFASGGGTGSGSGPMLVDLLVEDGKKVGAVTILPAQEESVKTHINAYECFTELTAIAGMGACFILDNNRGERMELNREFMTSFCSFLSIPEKHSSIKGNIDRAELMEALSAHGMAVVFRQEAGAAAGVIQCFTENIYAPMESDRAVKYITASLAPGVSMPEIGKAAGVAVDTFQTYNESETICCLSGLTYPKARLEAIYQKVEENRDTIRKNLEAAQETVLKEGVNFLDELTPVKKEAPKRTLSRRDIMNKYSVL